MLMAVALSSCAPQPGCYPCSVSASFYAVNLVAAFVIAWSKGARTLGFCLLCMKGL